MEGLLRLYKEDNELSSEHECLRRKVTAGENEMAKRDLDKILTVVVSIFNVAMLFLNLAASIISGSYSILSAFVDSAMDIVSSVIIFITIYAMKHTDKEKYPRGRARLEMIALIICSTVMSAGSFMVVFQSVQAILKNDYDLDTDIISISIISLRIIGKFIFMVICIKMATPNSRVLGIDQRNDLITSIVALAGAYLGDRFWLYFDPLGAIIVSLFISISWFVNALSYIPLIVGRRGNEDDMSRILHMAVNHDPRILKIDYVMSYHLGERQIVELHIVLDEECPLKVSHDIVSGLQSKLVALDFVDLAFVHADYKLDGAQ
ncbi:hypothetical protein FO519_003977 [Halicephalobus sp. NKZ332]|nr:hypothetical protein FO519_003977 [Halicephalobus sp. NKZ332]